MKVFSITAKETEAIKSFFTDETLENIEKDGYYTLGVYDEDYFVAGVLQFFIGSSQTYGSYGLINHIYIQEDFKDSEAIDFLIDEFDSILSSCNVKDRFIYMHPDSSEKSIKYLAEMGLSLKKDPAFIMIAPLEGLMKSDIICHVSVQNIGSISELDNNSFLKLQHDSGSKFCLPGSTDIESDVSSYFRSEKGCGLLLIKHSTDGVLVTSYLGTSTPLVGTNILSLIAYSTTKALELYDPNTSVQIICRNSASKELASKLLPDTEPCAYWYSFK